MRILVASALLLGALCSFSSSAAEAPDADEIRVLREQLARQQVQIAELQKALDAQDKALERLAQQSASAPSAVAVAAAAPVTALQPAAVSVDDLAKKTEAVSKNLGGFQFSGDFRYRLDVQARSGNEMAAPLQNVRSRYRLRLNIDKELDPRFKFHMQLSTGPYNNAITNDQDMAATVAKHPISIAEAYVNFQPSANISLRGGRMEEVFADNMRFLWDDDVRFNGFHQTVKTSLAPNALGFKTVELRMAEYILSNPAVYVLPANSPFVAAGYQVGQKVRDANLFHPGVILRGDISSAWSHQILGTFQIYRNPNQIQLASTVAGFPVVVTKDLGFVLSGPIGATGNATTTAGGAMYTARDFHIAHMGYRLERKGIGIAGREMPLWFDFQASRNTGAASLRDAAMVSLNLGAVRRAGDIRTLYQFAIKDANSVISQFTDDDLGTGTGVNLAVHAVRLDLGLTRFLQWQNLLFIQHQRRASNPSEQFFVPLQRGANATFRYLGQLAFTF